MNTDQLGNLLDALGVERLHYASSGWYRGCCPLHGELTPSFGVKADVPYHPYKCWVCGTGNLVGLVAGVKNIHFSEAEKWIRKFGDLETSSASFVKIKKFESRGAYYVNDVENYMIAPYEGKKLKLCSKRIKMPVPLLRNCRIGFDSVRLRVVYPWFWGGKLIGATGRYIGPADEDQPKTIPYFGLKKSHTLYSPNGGPTGRFRAVLVEGEKDALSAYRLWPDVFATGSTDFSQEQAQIIADNYAEAVIIRDPNRAGDIFVNNIWKRLNSSVKLLVCSHQSKDAGAMSPRELIEVYSKKELVLCRSLR